MPLSVAPLDLSCICEDVLAEFFAAHPDRSLRFERVGDLNGRWDAARLRQVLSNLIANAIEHGDESGAIEVQARGESSKVLLAVRNQGPVIDSAALPTIFNPFVRATSLQRSHKRRSGIGLGLYIAREIVIAHAGTITVASSEEIGTVFAVRLPRHNGRETPISDV